MNKINKNWVFFIFLIVLALSSFNVIASSCGDSVCDYNETDKTCSVDCISSSKDYFSNVFSLTPNSTNNSFTARIYSVPINYYNGTNFTAINDSIQTNLSGYAYGVERGLYKAYFKEKSDESSWLYPVKILEDEISLTLEPVGLTFTGDNSTNKQPANATISGEGNEITYHNQFDNIDLKYTYTSPVLLGKIIIENLSDLDNLKENVSSDDNLSFEFKILSYNETINQSLNMTILVNNQIVNVSDLNDTETNDTILILNEDGETIYSLSYPMAYNSTNNSKSLQYIVSSSESNELIVKVIAPYSWLSGQTYPLRIESSIDIFPFQYGRFADECNGGWYYYHSAFYAGPDGIERNRPYTSFWLGAIDEGAIIESVEFKHWLYDLSLPDCSGLDTHLHFHELNVTDYSQFPPNPSEDAEVQQIWNDIGDNLLYGSSPTISWGSSGEVRYQDLGIDGVQNVQSLIDGIPTLEFAIGLKVDSSDEVCGNSCFINLRGDDNTNLVITYSLDEEDPTTIVTGTSPPGGPEYNFGDLTSSSVEVILTCNDNDGSGCQYTNYCVDQSDTSNASTTYSSPFIISTEGTNYLRYYSVDNANNQESTQSKIVKIGLPNSTDELIDSYSFNYFSELVDFDYVTDYMADVDVDGTNDTLYFDIVLNSSTTGDYTFYIDLYEGSNRIIGKASKSISPSQLSLTVNISTYLLTKDKYNFSIRIYDSDNSLVYREDKLETQSYDSYESLYTVTNVDDENINNDLIRLTVTLDSNEASTENVSIFLNYDDNFISSTKEVSLIDGLNYITLDFDNETIKSTHYNGIYLIDTVMVSSKIIDLNQNTSSYDYETFAKTSYIKSYADTLVDSDANNLTDYLQIGFNLDIKEDGNYTIQAEIYDLFGGYLTSINETNTLSSGNQTINVQINGSEIYSSRLNGPFEIVSSKLLYNDSIVDQWLNSFVTNISYYQLFEKPPLPDLVISNLNIGRNGSDNLVNVTIENIGTAPAFNVFLDLFDNGSYSDQQFYSFLNMSENYTFNFVANNTPENNIFVAIVDFNNLVDELNETNNLPIDEDKNLIFNLSHIYQNNTSNIFEFIINNTINSSNNFSWQFDFGDGVVLNSTENIALVGNETIYVYVAYNYSSLGSYNVTAYVYGNDYSDSETISIVLSIIGFLVPIGFRRRIKDMLNTKKGRAKLGVLVLVYLLIIAFIPLVVSSDNFINITEKNINEFKDNVFVDITGVTTDESNMGIKPTLTPEEGDSTNNNQPDLTTIQGMVPSLFPLINETMPIEGAPVGYELVNDSGTEYLHVWNQGDIEPNYYYENNCLSQVSNILGEQWETVTKHIGTEINGQFYTYEWGTQDPCTREDDSDFETYTNNSATTNLHFGPLKIDLEMLSHLKTNDNYITQIYSIYTSKSSQGNDVYLILDSHDIQVAGDQENDYLKVKTLQGEEVFYNLTQIRNNEEEIWINSTEYHPFYFITDVVENKNILSSWPNNNYDWKIKIDGNITLYVNLEDFDNRETKYFEKQWVDAACMCFGISEITSDINWTEGNGTDIGNNLTMSCRFDITQGLGTCSGCAGLYRDDQMGTQRTIPTNANSSDILECNVLGQCGEKDIFYNGTWYDKTITCNSNGTVGTNCIHEDITGVVEVSSGIRYITCNLINESEARQAIEEGINNTILNGEIIKTDQQIYIRYLDNTQSLGYFDKFTSKDNQTWVFNYVNSSETFTNITSLGNTVNVWENSSLTYSQIVNQVESFINETLV